MLADLIAVNVEGLKDTGGIAPANIRGIGIFDKTQNSSFIT